MRLLHRYAEWTRKRANTAQCSPALMVLALLACCAVTIYIYRKIIIETVLTALIAVTAVAAILAITAITLSTVRWYRRRAALRPAVAEVLSRTDAVPALSVPSGSTVPLGTLSDAEDIAREADWLASGVELAWSPDGTTLKAKGS